MVKTENSKQCWKSVKLVVVCRIRLHYLENVRIYGSEHPQEFEEYQRDSPKINVWCDFMVDDVIGLFFFAAKTLNITDIHMLENVVF